MPPAASAPAQISWGDQHALAFFQPSFVINASTIVRHCHLIQRQTVETCLQEDGHACTQVDWIKKGSACGAAWASLTYESRAYALISDFRTATV